MTSLDLVQARSQQIQSAMARAIPHRVPGSDRSTREDTWGEATLHALGKVEEILAKAAGRIAFPDDPKYQRPFFGTTSSTTASFSDLFIDAGLDPLVAAVAGIGLALANPLDPLNKVNIGKFTKLGKVGKYVRGVGGISQLIEGPDGFLRFTSKNLVGKLDETKRLLQEGKLAKENIPLAEQSLASMETAIKHQDELNHLIVELQKRGATRESLELAPKFTDQVRLGQRSLLGFSSPMSLEHLSLLGLGRGPLDDSVRLSIGPAKMQAALAKAAVGLTRGFTAPILKAGKAVADALKIPIGKSDAAKKVTASIKDWSSKKYATQEAAMRDLESILRHAKEVDQLSNDDLLSILQAAEIPAEVKGVALDTLDEGITAGSVLTTVGRGIEESKVAGLSPGEKFQLTPQGISDSDIPSAIAAFNNAHIPGYYIGSQKEHQVKLVGQYVVVKAGSQKAKSGPVDELDKLFGNRVWARYNDDKGQTWLMAKRMPFSAPIGLKNPFDSIHLQNLESIAAQIANKKLALVGLKENDLLIAPNGAVQIINPDVLVTQKSSKDAIDNSRTVLESMAIRLGLPEYEFSALKNTKTAKAVPRGVDGLKFRSVSSNLPDGDYIGAQDLLNSSINTAIHRQYVEHSFQTTTTETAQRLFGNDPSEFERANNIEFHRQQLRIARQNNTNPSWPPLEVTQDDFGNVWVSGVDDRNRLTAAILEGIEVVPIKRVDNLSAIARSEDGYFLGNFQKLREVWSEGDNTSAAYIADSSRNVVSARYGVVASDGSTVKLTEDAIRIAPELNRILSQFVILGPQFVGKARSKRLESVYNLLDSRFGNRTNALLAVSDLAEASPNAQEFAKKLETLLVNPESKQGIRLDNVFRHPDAEDTFIRLKNAAQESLDASASRGVITTGSIDNLRRLKLASEMESANSTDHVIQTIDPNANIVRFVSSSASNQHLRSVADSFLNKSGTAADVDQYARVILHGTDGELPLKVSDFVTQPHPGFQGNPSTTLFRVSDAKKAEFEEAGIYVVNKDTVKEVHDKLAAKGLDLGVLLSKKEIKGVPKIIRPEFAYFITRAGDIIIGTKHKDVRDLMTAVFKEGPRYTQEFGIMTTGKIIISNLFGTNVAKLGAGELKMMVRRLKDIATRFRDLGFSNGTVLDTYVPFDNATWRAMYGERVTIHDILKESYKLDLPEEMLGHAVDNSLDTPLRYVDVDMQKSFGVVAIEKTRLKDPRLQSLLSKIEDTRDSQFIDEAKAGLPVSYYESYWGRFVTKEAREAMQEFRLKNPDKNAQSFKNVESWFNPRLWTDITTQEANQILKRLSSQGYENADSIITDVVKEMRDGYVMKPTKELASSLVAVSRMLPEGVDFFYTHPIYSLSLRLQQGIGAITRKGIVDSLKDLGVVVWHGTTEELRQARVGSSAAIKKLEVELKTTTDQLNKAQDLFKNLTDKVPDIKTVEAIKAQQEVDRLKTQLADLLVQKSGMIDKLGKGKIMDTMVDLNAEEVWARSEDITRLVNEGVIKDTDVVGDMTDAFVRVPIKKYESLLSASDAEVYLFPREVAAEVQRYFGSTTKDGFNKFLALWDEVHSAWRAWTLFPIPSYHIRNGISSMFMAWLGGVTDPRSYKLSMQVMQLMTSHRKGVLSLKEVNEALESIVIPSANGTFITGRDLLGSFIHNGGLSGGLHYNEYSKFGDIKRLSDFTRMVKESGLHPASEMSGSWIFDNVAVRYGVKQAAFVENRFRLATFIDAFRRGHVERNGDMVLTGTDAAAMHMKKVFYDYSDLSAFEQSWLRRIIPFYSWSRHNVPRMLTTLVSDPTKHYRIWKLTDDLERGVTNEQVSEDELPEWIRERYGIIISKTKDGAYVVKTADGFLPMTDAYKAISRGGIFTMFKDGLTPFVKTPLEQIANLSLYSNQKIEHFPGQKAKSFVLGELGFTRRVSNEGPLGPLNILLNESLFRSFFRPGYEAVDKVLDPILDPRNFGKEKPGVFAIMLGLFIGRAYTIDPDKAKMAFYKDWSKRRGQITALRNNAVKVGDTQTVEQLDSMLNWLQLGYPGKE